MVTVEQNSVVGLGIPLQRRRAHSRINFVNDELRRRSRIRCSRDRTSHNEVIGSKTDRFAWSRNAFVIVG